MVRIISTFAIAAVSFMGIGCAAHNKPVTSKTKVDPVAYLKVAGCDSGKKFKDVPGQLKDYRAVMTARYGRFMDSKGYKGEKKILDQCDSVDAIDRYFAEFWRVRDPDISTPVNEYKAEIDKRIREIEAEILFNDGLIPGTTFKNNGGLTGEMAHVYMFRGNPHYKTILRGTRIADLMAWVYFDPNQRPLFVFLFYDNGTGYRLFRNYRTMDTYEGYLDTLKIIARVYPTTIDDLIQLDRELELNDTEFIFRFALRQFSYYSDIKIDKVLAPPTPEAITAKALQPAILGLPNIPKDMKIIFNPYVASIPGFFRINMTREGNYTSTFVFKHADIDWEEAEGDALKADFDISISFINEETRETKVFTFEQLSFGSTKQLFEASKDKYFVANLDKFRDAAGMSISDIAKSLEPGDYEVKVRLLNVRTLKSGIWFNHIAIR